MKVRRHACIQSENSPGWERLRVEETISEICTQPARKEPKHWLGHGVLAGSCPTFPYQRLFSLSFPIIFYQGPSINDWGGWLESLVSGDCRKLITRGQWPCRISVRYVAWKFDDNRVSILCQPLSPIPFCSRGMSIFFRQSFAICGQHDIMLSCLVCMVVNQY